MSDLIDALVRSPEMEAAFSNAALIAAMLRFEVALARAEARAGVVPDAAAAAIASIKPDAFDATAIVSAARASATPAIPFVEALVAAVGAADPEAAKFVHRGATSQDVTDTALVLCLRGAIASIAATHTRLSAALRRLSDQHASTVMLGRTLLQPATPITFGLKAAGWLGSLDRSYTQVAAAFDRACVLQFGGAAGTLAALGPDGLRVSENLARELELPLPDAPWHAHRDRPAALVAACGVYAGAIAKGARDVALLMQAEVAEASEPGGGSSTMPHKRNPAACVVAIASASRLPGLVATMISGMAQEHERGAGGGQAEWATVADAVMSMGSAAAAFALAVEGLQVDAAAMRRSIDGTRGAVFAERAMMRLVPALGRERATRIVAEALAATAHGTDFADALFAHGDALAVLTDEDRRTLTSPEAYLGSAEAFRRRLLHENRD